MARTLRDAAASLGLSPTTLRVQIRNGKLHGAKIGRDWVVADKELERYRRENRQLIHTAQCIVRSSTAFPLCRCADLWPNKPHPTE